MAATPPVIEVCVEGLDNMVAAQTAGADRVELCASLVEGGLTPSEATIRHALRLATVPVHVIVRPRGGDFLYSDTEFASMLDDVASIAARGAPGVVIGCLTADGRIDESRTRALVQAAGTASVTFHRAFDMTRDVDEALEAVVRCGVHRILTSGQSAQAVDAVDVLKRLHERAAARLTIMGCGRLTRDTIGLVRRATGLREFHFSAPQVVPSPMTYRNTKVGMGGTAIEREYQRTITDGAAVRATIEAARA